MKKFETLKAGLGNGLIVSPRVKVKDNTLGYHFIEKGESVLLYGMSMFTYSKGNTFCQIHSREFNSCINDLTPHLFPFSHLAKPIRVEGYNGGEEFVPVKVFQAMHLHDEDYESTDLISPFKEEFSLKEIPFGVIQLLCDWHFNVFNLQESDYIDASKSKVYEPK